MKNKLNKQVVTNILSCFGKVNVRSAAKLCGVTYHNVYYYWNRYSKSIKKYDL